MPKHDGYYGAAAHLMQADRLPDVFAFPDGRFEVRWKRCFNPYSVFDKNQRVTHAAITENKHLSAVLEYIKAEQDKAAPKKRRTMTPAAWLVRACDV